MQRFPERYPCSLVQAIVNQMHPDIFLEEQQKPDHFSALVGEEQGDVKKSFVSRLEESRRIPEEEEKKEIGMF